MYGGTLVAVDGNYDDVNRLASEIAGEEEDWAFVNVNVRPYYAEGSKTLGYEVAEQLGWRLPEQVVIPIASGSQLTKIDKAFTEFGKLGLVDATPYRVFGAQAEGCSPVVDGVQGRATTSSSRSGRTPSPSRWRSATRPTALTCSTSCRRTDGAVEDVTDDEIVDGHPTAGRDRGHLRRDGGRRHRRRAAQAAGRRHCSTPTRRRSSSTPVTV